MINTPGETSGINAEIATSSDTINSDNSDLSIISKSLAPSVERKISSNLLYILDSNIPEKGLNRQQAASILRESGQMKTVQLESDDPLKQTESGNTVNLIYVFVDFFPSEPVSGAVSYFEEVTELNDEDNTVAGWADVNTVDQIASLPGVVNIRAGEPAITKESPVYRDMKFLDKRSGLAPATVDEAKASVQSFENVSKMVLEPEGTMTNSRGEIHSLISNDAKYYVNAKTGAVEMASYNYHANFPVQKPLERFENISASARKDRYPLTADSAFPIAQDFARQMYNNYDNRSLVLTQYRIIDHGDAGKTGLFIWNEKVNDVTTPNGVVVSVNAYDGKILGYIGIDRQIETDIVPSVSKENAIEKAVSRFSTITLNDTNARLAVLPMDERNQILVWHVDVTGEPEDNFDRGGSVIVDAHSGEVLEVDPYA